MKRLILISLLFAGVVQAAPVVSNLNLCAAWLDTYQQFHPEDKDTSILLSDYEGELKRLDLYNVNEIENALDSDMMLSAADNSEQTRKDLMHCREIAQNFKRVQ
ncbi:hypothetical protein DEEACLCL_00184 [Salmonella phage CRW-SP2]|nr:hypothetical protein DEEACLCL_00184 [Salmonella phage CRW-SP2]